MENIHNNLQYIIINDDCFLILKSTLPNWNCLTSKSIVISLLLVNEKFKAAASKGTCDVLIKPMMVA